METLARVFHQGPLNNSAKMPVYRHAVRNLYFVITKMSRQGIDHKGMSL
jgi:hypothetical protein